MLATLIALLATAFLLCLVALALLLRWGAHWGATAEETSMPLPGDPWLEGGPPARVRMTRAVTVDAPADVVWPWLAQAGRGAGWYSIDRLDNGGRESARHLVSWIPEPELGDATTIGYLRYLDAGRDLVWWLPGVSLCRAKTRTVMAYRLTPNGERTRVVARFSWDAAGFTAWPVLRFFQAVDCVMARRQLLGLKERAELHGNRPADPEEPETGAVDQYQLYHVIYASGREAGARSKENADTWRRAAIHEGLIPTEESTPAVPS